MAAVDPALAARRSVSVARLRGMDERGELASEHVRLAAEGLGVSERTVWRDLARARAGGDAEDMVPTRFSVDDVLRKKLAFWRGNAAAVHRELADAAADAGKPVPSLATLHRAIRRDLSAGERAGLRRGERTRRGYDVFLARPGTHRNAAWEADHVEAPVQVSLDGRWLKPWVSWFVDAATNVVCGVAVTPGYPSRESILTAVRAAILRDEPYGPAGGLPGCVRIDRGKDFLSRVVSEALAAFAVRVAPLPRYEPHLKGTVETLNGAAEAMFFARLPRYTHAQTLLNGGRVDPDQPGLSFESFTAELFSWVRWWNDEHTSPELDGQTPRQAWLSDPTPVEDVPARDLWYFTLEDDGRVRTITTKGISWGGRGRRYVADWMVGRVGAKVRVRYMPHHDHEIEVFDAACGEHLGAAVLADQAPAEVVTAVISARARQRKQLAADLRAAEKTRRARYAAQATTGPARAVGAVTRSEAATELAEHAAGQLGRWARPDLVPPRAAPAGWVDPIVPGATSSATAVAGEAGTPAANDGGAGQVGG
jgi:putative transposase